MNGLKKLGGGLLMLSLQYPLAERRYQVGEQRRGHLAPGPLAVLGGDLLGVQVQHTQVIDG